MYKSLADAIRDAEARGQTLAQVALDAESSEDGGQDSGAASGRSGDDHTHGGVDLLHGEGSGEDVAKWRVGERPFRSGSQLGRVSADQS